MQISELYKKSTMGDKLEKFSNEMLASTDTLLLDNKLRTFKQILCDEKSYSNNDFDVYRSMTCGFTESAYSNILTFCVKYNESIKYNIGISGQELTIFSRLLGKNILNIDHNDVEQLQNAINKSVDEYTAIPLSDILSCSDFINVFNGPESDIKNRLQDLLSKHTEMSYDDVKKAVDPSLLSSENKKIVFAKVLPEYNFKVCNEFNSTWDIFEKGYIDFDTLVTKFWARDDFGKNDKNSNQKEKNVFQNFASEYKNYTDYRNNDIGSLKSSAKNMINELSQKGVIADHDIQNLKNQIDNATDVGVLGIIAQFFKNLFSKDKTAFKPIQQTKQDRIISNLKPLSGLLREATKINKDIQQK